MKTIITVRTQQVKPSRNKLFRQYIITFQVFTCEDMLSRVARDNLHCTHMQKMQRQCWQHKLQIYTELS